MWWRASPAVVRQADEAGRIRRCGLGRPRARPRVPDAGPWWGVDEGMGVYSIAARPGGPAHGAADLSAVRRVRMRWCEPHRFGNRVARVLWSAVLSNGYRLHRAHGPRERTVVVLSDREIGGRGEERQLPAQREFPCVARNFSESLRGERRVRRSPGVVVRGRRRRRARAAKANEQLGADGRHAALVRAARPVARERVPAPVGRARARPEPRRCLRTARRQALTLGSAVPNLSPQGVHEVSEVFR